MAKALGDACAQVIIFGLNAEHLHNACESLYSEDLHATSIEADLAKPEEAKRFCDVLLHDHAPIDILINNFGGRRINTPMEDLELTEWKRIIDLNLTQAFILTKWLGGAMSGPHHQHRLDQRTVARQGDAGSWL